MQTAQFDLYERRLARERAARKEAEALLEKKARELYEANVDLQSLILELDTVVSTRTSEALAARDEAVAANQAKSAFLANMSHEIRTPLTSIIGFAHLLLDKRYASTDREATLRTIMLNGQHLLQIISDILDVSKIEAEGLELEVLDVPLAELLSEVENLMAPRAREKELRFRVAAAHQLPKVIQTDSVRTKQILMNFCSNAIKFTAHGTVTLQAQFDATKNELELGIADTGIGLTPEQIDKLFQPFAQADISTTRRFGGTGLGLYICRQLAERMGCALGVRSTPGAGSVFFMRMPVAPEVLVHGWMEADSLQLSAPDAPKEQAELEVPALAGEVLLAEDGPHNQKLIRAYIEPTGAKLTVVGNGELALEAALSGTFDLVLMDIQMPVMDGTTAITMLRDSGYVTPIVALTANVMSQDIEQYKRIGCDDVVGKPIDTQRLYAVMQRYLREASRSATTSSAAAAAGQALDDVRHGLAQQFLAELPATLDTIEAAIAAEEWDTLRRVTHGMKGLAGSLGFPRLTDLAKPIEPMLHAGKTTAALVQTGQLLEACRNLLQQLQEGAAAATDSTEAPVTTP